jgi:hypothetical protein
MNVRTVRVGSVAAQPSPDHLARELKLEFVRLHDIADEPRALHRVPADRG